MRVRACVIDILVIKCTAGTLECDGEGQKSNFILNGLAISLESAPIAIFCLVTETKGQTFREIPRFYSTSGAVVTRQ